MSNFSKVMTEDRRLAILRLLIEIDGKGNESVLFTGLEEMGHVVELTRESLRADLQFLADRGLIRQEWFADKLVVAHIKTRGVEVAQGRTSVEGVKKPRLGE
jgi:hypothetical protein